MKRIFPEQLANALSQHLASLYVLAGDDPLLLVEAEDQIRQVASSQGFDEKCRLTLDNHTDWDTIFERMQAMGLFFQRQIIHLVCPENLSANVQQHLLTLVKNLHSDILLILQLPKWNKTLEKQKWFVAGSQVENSAIIPCQTPTYEQLPHYIQQRAKRMGLTLEEKVLPLLCYHYEGNLLALKQTLDLLSLLYPDGKLSLSRVEKVVEEACIFTVFQWVEALLLGQGQRAEHILCHLQQEDVHVVILLRTLQRELTTLLQLTQVEKGINIDSPLATSQLRQKFDKLGIWQNRRGQYLSAIHRLTYRQLFEVIQDLAKLECQAKQTFQPSIWQELGLLGYRLSAGQ